MKTSINPNRWWDLPAALLLFVAIFMATLRLIATKWTDELSITHLIVIFGIIAGFILGLSGFSRRFLVLFASVYGIFAVGLQLGRTMGEGIAWLERVTSLGNRLGISINNLAQQKAVTDPVLFLLLMCTLFWVLSVHAGYSLTRHANPWQATIPTGLALFIIHINDPYWPTRTWYLAGYIFLSILLLSRLTFIQKQAEWQKNRTHLPPYVGLDFLRVTLIAGVIMILAAWTAPALAANVPPVRQAWNRIATPYYQARDRMSNMFASLRSSVGIVRDYYGESLPLGRGNTLTDNVVLSITAPPRPTTAIRFYWRARTYDLFEDRQWLVTRVETQDVNPDDFALNLPETNIGRWEAEFIVLTGVPMATLYTAPQPTWISRPIRAEFATNQDSTIDLWALQATPALRAGDSYEFRSLLTNATVTDLRASGTEYPDWIKARYLQIPDHITPRTIELAKRIGADLETPYDIANAVTQYLRNNIEYTETIPSPPSNQDIIDWVLFDLKQGFCNYYATAEVILLRSLGIPARLAVGYAQGEWDAETETFTIHQRDAHAWPEVYFSGIGWVEFEPTVNQQPITRLVGGDSENENSNSGSPLANNLNMLDEIRPDELPDDRFESPDLSNLPELNPPTPFWVWLIIPGVLLIFLSFFTWYSNKNQQLIAEKGITISNVWADRLDSSFAKAGIKPPRFLHNWIYQTQLPPQARAYREINRALNRLGHHTSQNQTPAERAQNLSHLLPNAGEPIIVLLTEYHAHMYGTSPGNAAIALEAARKIRHQSWYTRGQALLERITKSFRR